MISAPPKTKYPAEAAKRVARALCEALGPCCEMNEAEGRPYLKVAGSLRRRKAMVGDIEILCVAKYGAIPDGGLFTRNGSLLELMIDELLKAGAIAKRPNVNGSATWGPKNKLAVHVASGIPVDIFITRPAAWYNYVVCRTGGVENNAMIALAAQRRGLKWHPCDDGFSVTDAKKASVILNRELAPGQGLRVTCEEDVYNFVGLPFLPPEERT